MLGKVWIAIVQLLSLAILPRVWGANDFGQWLMIATIPTYLSVASLGFGDAAATSMTRAIANGDRESARHASDTAWVLVSGTTFVVAAAVAMVIGLAVSARLASIEIGSAALVLVLFSFLSVQTGLIQAAYRASGRYALGAFAVGLMPLFEGLAVVAIAYQGGGAISCALAMLSLRLVGVVLLWKYIHLREPWYSIGVRGYSRHRMAELRRPALAALGLTAGDALALQGMIVALGIAASPTAAATFGAARTLCRLPLQASDVLGRASTPELTVANATGDSSLFDRLTLMNIASAVLVAFPMLLVCAIFGDKITRLMTGGAIEFSATIFPAMALIVAFQALRTAISHSLFALNEQHRFTGFYVCSAVLLVATTFWWGGRLSLTELATIWAILEFFVLVAALRGVRAVRKDAPRRSIS